jgi:FkbM family methyltransferase
MGAMKSAAIRMLDAALPQSFKDSFFHLSFNLARPEFHRFAFEYAQAPDMRLGLSAMKQRGFIPHTIIDVGAFEGAWSSMARQIWPHAKIVMIEPNRSKADRLSTLASEISAEYFCELLGAREGANVSFHVMGSGSSVFAERSPLARETETRALTTLDSLRPSVDRPLLLKIDAQGYELEILKGAGETLRGTDAIVLEIAVIEINEGAPLLHTVVEFMCGLGFVTYDVLEIHRRPLDKALNQIDIVFVRQDSPLIADKRLFAIG